MDMANLSGLGTRTAAQALRAGALVVVWIILATSCTGSSPRRSPPPGQTSTLPSSPTQPSGVLPLGTLTETSGPSACRSGWTCYPFEVTCPEVQLPAAGDVVVQAPQGQARGLVVMLLGAFGGGFERVSEALVGTLTQKGLEVAVVDWEDSWLRSAPGEEVGPKRLACRSATVIQWAHDGLYKDLGEPKADVGTCGFCITGNSGGASQGAYALSFYGLAKIIDSAVLSGGPPHAALDEGCLQVPEYAYKQRNAGVIDASYGFRPGRGPCWLHDESFQDRWEADSADVGGTFRFPMTRVALLFVEGDRSSAPRHGMDYLNQLRAADSPMVSDSIVPGRSHDIQRFPEGQDALATALLSGVS